jgi:hypothetical protein
MQVKKYRCQNETDNLNKIYQIPGNRTDRSAIIIQGSLENIGQSAMWIVGNNRTVIGSTEA